MNQVGQDAWHLHMQYIVDGVTRFVNRMNRNYTGEGIGMNPTEFPNFLFPGLPPAINTRVYNNAFEISIGIMSSSLDREDLNDVHNSAIEDIEDPTDDDDDDAGFPLGLENLENLEKWEGIFQSGKSQGILNRLEKSGKSQGKSHKILENLGNLK